MSSDSIEKQSGLFAETSVYNKEEQKPKYEHEEGLEFGQDFDFDSEFDKYAAMGEAEKRSGTFWTNCKRMEFPLNISHTKMVVILGLFAAFSGLLSGLDQSLISGASIGMDKALHFNSHENSLVSSLMPLGAVAGSILLTPLQKIGRKNALLASAVMYVGAILCAAAPIPRELADGTFDNSRSRDVIYAGRFLLGVGVGIEGGSVGVYISESVPSNFRGRYVSVMQLSIAIGEVLGFAVAAIFFEVHGGWRFMLGSSLVFSTIFFIGLLFLPESPRFLVFKGKFGEAFNVFARLRDVNDRRSKIEFVQIVQAAEAERELRLTQSKLKVWGDLFTIPRNRRALVYGVMMISLGQLTGINAVMYYLSTLMSRIGFTTKNAVFMSLVGGGALLIGTIPGVLYMDKFGRRVWGFNIVGFLIGLVLVGVGYSINIETNLAAAEGVYLTGLILYMGFFGSYACLTWVVPSESFSIGTRSQGMSICSALLYLWAFTVTYNFNRMKEAFTYTGLTVGFYGGIAFLGFFYQVLFMPETKGKTLEEIDAIFEKPSMQLAKENLQGLKRFWGH
ncbi:hypothetical protein G210_0690 [Candida maltosa Xu316]|uniref:Major facilitator superfamily (MFS) profile domain-containing protein n=1 Tax=Candida maltosa (strain Xu316) TaxID=1245528 RepID=M3J9C3_CANMX|nr:hypothetical protein G210_0690 [Candida maltosa Xu316]